ncbi:hypothetical protein MTR67_011224 [Solanum verrucosum]|uniref:Uncharacterized protein n=1 Tax=Solanum verrucosum TaxID=315347 RepID=A0AAF0QDB7_SOLVR|nr:hypothetical protein MTR67_011224 [Solanum verrucosum]
MRWAGRIMPNIGIHIFSSNHSKLTLTSEQRGGSFELEICHLSYPDLSISIHFIRYLNHMILSNLLSTFILLDQNEAFPC